MVEVNVRGLAKQYGDKTALHSMNFTATSGEVIGLLGQNGAGKSTLMNIMTGYLAASAGQVLIDGMDVMEHHAVVKSKIGYLPEHAPLYLELTVRQYLSFLYDLKQIKAAEGKQQHLDAISERVQIAAVSKRLIKNLSKGYRQRIGLAQALLGHPPLLFLDEPSVGLDPTQRMEMRRLIQELGTNSLVFVSSHILSELEAICSRIIMIDHGRMMLDTSMGALQLGSKQELLLQVEGEPKQVVATLSALPFVRECVIAGASSSEGVTQYQLLLREGEVTQMKRELFFALAEQRLPLLELRDQQMTLEERFSALLAGNTTTTTVQGATQDDDDL